MANYLTQIFGLPAPQDGPMPGREQETVQNSEDGFVFPVDEWVRLERFLILGSEGGSYYASERRLSLEHCEAVRKAVENDGMKAVRMIVKISDSGRAPKNDPALFALALAAAFAAPRGRAAAFRALPVVARTGSHLFRFVEYVTSMRGWGRGLRKAVADWYTARPVGEIAYQAVKYRLRGGWSHRDLLRLTHPRGGGARGALYGWIAQGRTVEAFDELRIIEGFEQIQRAGSAAEAARLVKRYRLTREMIPTSFLDSPEIWEALLDRMPLAALVRNLATLTRAGVLRPLFGSTREVVRRLTDKEAIRRARLHPVQVLAALLTYQSGRGARSSKTWPTVRQVVDALEAAFELSFETAPAGGKRFYLGLDVSGSMGMGEVAGVPGLTPRVAAAAMAMAIARREPQYHVAAFSGGFEGTPLAGYGTGAPRMAPLAIAASDSLTDVCAKTDGLPFGGTDCALPMLDALERRLPVDCFVVLTDSETWAGTTHPAEALRKYRAEMGIPAKLVVVGMVSNGFSIADPTDAGMLDVVGFDTATPNLIADFASA